MSAKTGKRAHESADDASTSGASARAGAGDGAQKKSKSNCFQMLILAASLIASVQAAKEQVPPPQRGSWDATVLTHFSNAFDADLNDDKTIYLADGECDANGNPIESVKGMPERCIRYGFMGLPFMALNWRTLIAHVLGERTAGTELPYNIEFFHAPGGGDGGGGPAGGGGGGGGGGPDWSAFISETTVADNIAATVKAAAAADAAAAAAHAAAVVDATSKHSADGVVTVPNKNPVDVALRYLRIAVPRAA